MNLVKPSHRLADLFQIARRLFMTMHRRACTAGSLQYSSQSGAPHAVLMLAESFRVANQSKMESACLASDTQVKIGHGSTRRVHLFSSEDLGEMTTTEVSDSLERVDCSTKSLTIWRVFHPPKRLGFPALQKRCAPGVMSCTKPTKARKTTKTSFVIAASPR